MSLCLAAPEFCQELADFRIMLGKLELQERIVVVEAVVGFGHLGEKGPFIQKPRVSDLPAVKAQHAIVLTCLAGLCILFGDGLVTGRVQLLIVCTRQIVQHR